MGFKDYTFQIALRIVGLVFTMGLGFYLAFEFELLFSLILLGLFFLAQAFELWNYQMRIVKETRKFLEAVRFEDYSSGFELAQSGKAFAKLEQEFTKLLNSLKNSRSEGDHHQEVLAMVLENVSVGLMLIDEDGKIILSNERCAEILGIPVFKDWSKMVEKLPSLGEAVGDFSFNGRKLWAFPQAQNDEEFYLDLRHLQIQGQKLHLLSIGNLRTVVEEKEINAWSRLMRILAHEVMNSVTPVVSLSETLNAMIHEEGKLKKVSDLEEDDMADISEGLITIVRRSKGMLAFVDEYRKLSQIPAPEKRLVSIKDLFDGCIALMQQSAQDQGVEISAELEQNRLAIEADQKMIEQVIINLIKNALAALEGKSNGRIDLQASLGEEGVVIVVKDNGEGIDDELLPQIFIPFFTTRKNGSGIGLSLSKNIMKLHNGDLRVKSQAGEGAVFSLCFCDKA